MGNLVGKLARREPLILWFDECGIDDIGLVGGKNASLGEMVRHLKSAGVKVPNGFAITSAAYRYVLEASGAMAKLQKVMKDLDVTNAKALARAGLRAREIILQCEFPEPLKEAIDKAYKRLCKEYHSEHLDVAVRSSATAEDLPEASFAGQQESFLNIRGIRALLDSCKRCFASLFTNRAIVYREEHHFDHFSVGLSIGVQKMVRSDMASAGVIFTLDTETGFPDVVYITGSWGLGESVVQGAVNPDEFYIFKPTFKKGFPALIDKRIGNKATKIVYTHEGTQPTKKVSTPIQQQHEFCLSDKEALTLAKWALLVEDHYSKRKGKWVPMDLEWGKDGKTGELYILQARPETVQSQKKSSVIEEYRLLQKGKVLTLGKSVGSKIAQGRANVIEEVKNIAKFKKGDVLVTDMTDPDWVPIMRMASAIVTNRGGRTSHAAIVSRELGLPCIVGTNDATEKIKTGQSITVNCAEGENGIVYEGLLKFKVEKIDVKKMPQTKTKLMLNVGYPDEALSLSFLPSEGVGLARQEFIVTESIQVHPLALIHFDKVKDPKERKKIQMLTAGYADKKRFFVDKLAMGVALLAASFYPRDVILRFSDFKTNEYANLIGGQTFEPKEQNPMIGWRGASRYYKPGYREGFELECQAIKKVREEFGLTNLKVMVPMCRTVEEGEKVLNEMAKHGLKQGQNGLEVYVMCEVPSNVILAEEFSSLFDGFSIGSNDLTQMTLAVDRDNELVADIFDERNPAIKRLVSHVIKIAKSKRRKIGICGDAPSTYPEFAEFLVDCGIDSISLSKDALIRTRIAIAKYEKKRKRRK